MVNFIAFVNAKNMNAQFNIKTRVCLSCEDLDQFLKRWYGLAEERY